MTQKIGVILPLSFGQQPEPPPIGRSAAPLSLYSARRLAGSWLLGFAIDWDIIIYALIPIIVLLFFKILRSIHIKLNIPHNINKLYLK